MSVHLKFPDWPTMGETLELRAYVPSEGDGWRVNATIDPTNHDAHIFRMPPDATAGVHTYPTLDHLVKRVLAAGDAIRRWSA